MCSDTGPSAPRAHCAGFYGVGPVCWKPCQSGYYDGGFTCFRGASSYGKGCCCTVFTKGCCRNCQSGFTDTGCSECTGQSARDADAVVSAAGCLLINRAGNDQMRLYLSRRFACVLWLSMPLPPPHLLQHASAQRAPTPSPPTAVAQASLPHAPMAHPVALACKSLAHQFPSCITRASHRLPPLHSRPRRDQAQTQACKPCLHA
jgi:hypothetical protein